MPKNNRQVKSIISSVIFLSSLFAKIRETNGEVLNKVHPIAKGRVLKTICCSNMPIFVPRNIDAKNLFC